MHHMTSHDNTWHHNPHVSVTLVCHTKQNFPKADWHWFKSCHAEPYVSDVTSAQKWHGPHFSNKALPPSRQQLADSWLGRSAASLLIHIEISTVHVTQSLKCHMSQVLKKVEQSKEELDSLVPPSAQLAAGWLTADWGGSQGLAAAWLSAGEAFPPSSSSSHFPDYFHTFPRRKSAISPRFLFIWTFSIFNIILDLQKRLSLFIEAYPVSYVFANNCLSLIFMTRSACHSVWKQGDKQAFAEINCQIVRYQL